MQSFSTALRGFGLNWRPLSWLGDAGLMAPMAAAVLLALLLAPGTRALAVRWALTMGGVAAIVVSTKLAYLAWGIGSRQLHFTGVSGHSAFAATVWPVLFWLLLSRFGVPLRAGAVACGLALAIGVTLSRIALRAHSESEAFAGLLLGSLAAALLLRATWAAEPPKAAQIAVLGTAAALVGAFLYGRPMPTAQWLQGLTIKALHVDEPHRPRDMHRPRIPARESAEP